MNELTTKFIGSWNLSDPQVDCSVTYNDEITINDQTTSKKIHYIHSPHIPNNQFKLNEIKNNSAINTSSEIMIPISILRDNSSMQSIVHHLKKKNYTFKEISRILNRDQRTIWSIYHKKKSLNQSKILEDYAIPVTIFQNRRLSVLENIVLYLKLEYALEFTEIAKLLGKNYRTIWTIYQRIKIKNNHNE